EAINRRAASLKRREFVLVEAAARKNGDAWKAALIENAPDGLGKRDQIAAVETDRANRNSFRLKPLCERHNLSGRGLCVIGVDQNSKILRPGVRKCFERGGLAVECF